MLAVDVDYGKRVPVSNVLLSEGLPARGIALLLRVVEFRAAAAADDIEDALWLWPLAVSEGMVELPFAIDDTLRPDHVTILIRLRHEGQGKRPLVVVNVAGEHDVYFALF